LDKKNHKYLFNKYENKSLLFIGPGRSRSKIDLKKSILEHDYTASLNEVFLKYATNFYFVGEKYIYDYVSQDTLAKKNLLNTYTFFLGLNKNHSKRIDTRYYKKVKSRGNNNKLSFIAANLNLNNKLKYNLKINSDFSPTKKNRIVLANLLHNFPINKEYYIRSRTLSNALQVVFNLGFSRVSYIGFMDSVMFTRDNYEDQKNLIKLGKKRGLKLQPANERPRDFLSRSFLYQSQIIKTLNHIYKEHGKELIDINPDPVVV
jgi:hypothetical protein